MILLEAIILGVVQGFTEFLPISSSAHLIVLPWMFGWQGTLVDSLNYDVALHAGPLVAITAFFWRDSRGLLRNFIGRFGEGASYTGAGRRV